MRATALFLCLPSWFSILPARFEEGDQCVILAEIFCLAVYKSGERECLRLAFARLAFLFLNWVR